MKSLHSNRGFSLVEIVVVVGIVLILVALAFGGSRASNRSARQATCSARLHQVGALLEVWGAEHKDTPAPVRWQIDTSWDNAAGRGWDVVVGRAYAALGGEQSIWACPAGQTPYVGNARALGFERRVEDRFEAYPSRIAFRSDPARLVLTYDVQANLRDSVYAHATPSAADLSDEYYDWPSEGSVDVSLWLPQWGPHDEKYGLLFGDGHAEVRVTAEGDALLWRGRRWWPTWVRPSPPSAGIVE